MNQVEQPWISSSSSSTVPRDTCFSEKFTREIDLAERQPNDESIETSIDALFEFLSKNFGKPTRLPGSFSVNAWLQCDRNPERLGGVEGNEKREYSIAMLGIRGVGGLLAHCRYRRVNFLLRSFLKKVSPSLFLSHAHAHAHAVSQSFSFILVSFLFFF